MAVKNQAETGAVADGQKHRSPPKKMALQRQQTVFLITIFAVPVLHWLVFWLYVNFNMILLAFKMPDGVTWTLNNFAIFWDSLTYAGGEINIALRNTLIYFANNLLILAVSVFIAYFLYRKIALYRTFRIIFYLPAIISGVVMAAVYKEVIKPWGIFGKIMEWLNHPLPETGLLGNKNTATLTIVVYCFWTGFSSNVLLVGGAITRIPIEILESAKIEGIGPMRELGNMILPLIWPTISTVLIFTMTGIFNSTGPLLLFTNGNYETTTISYWIFQQVYNPSGSSAGQYGIVSCTGLCFTLVGVPLILFVKWLIEKIPAVEY